MLNVEQLTVRYGSLTIVDDIRFSVEEGQWLMIAGPNGAGKSTLLDAITLGVPCTGSILYEERDVRKMSPKERARSIGFLAQNHFVNYAFSVEEVVRLGCYSLENAEDEEKNLEEALRITGMDKQRRQNVLTLSGGELQRTFLAQVFAQNPKLLLLDEPTNHLDLIYQKQVFGILREWLKTPGRAVISVVHDLSLAKAYGTHALLMNRGKAVACGETDSVLTTELLNPVYQMDVADWMQSLLGQWTE